MDPELVLVSNLQEIISEKLQNLRYQALTKAYIAGVFSASKKEDYSKESLTLVYARARLEHRFDLFQNLADWILFSQTMFPESLNNASKEYYQCIAQDSYYKCYRLINKKWLFFEELADNFPIVVNTLQSNIKF